MTIERRIRSVGCNRLVPPLSLSFPYRLAAPWAVFALALGMNWRMVPGCSVHRRSVDNLNPVDLISHVEGLDRVFDGLGPLRPVAFLFLLVDRFKGSADPLEVVEFFGTACS